MGETSSHKEKTICGWENYFSESLRDRRMMKQPLMSLWSLLRRVGLAILVQFGGRRELLMDGMTKIWFPVDLPTLSDPEACIKTKLLARQWWCTPLIPALGRQKQADLWEFEDSLANFRDKELWMQTSSM